MVDGPLLNTARLILRPPTLDDAPALQAGFARWAIIRHLATHVPWPYPDNGAAAFLRERLLPRIAEGKGLAWVIAERGVGTAIGMIEYTVDAGDLGNRGFWLAEPYQGRGFMTEAIEAVQDYLFFERGLDRLIVTNAVGNVASRRVKEKTGARLLGVFESATHGGSTQSERWEITAADWARHRGRSQA